MKKIMISIFIVIMLFGINTVCYADLIIEPTVTEILFNSVSLDHYLSRVSEFYIMIPLIIFCGILIKVVLKKNKEKARRVKVKKCLGIFLSVILFSMSIVGINSAVKYNIKTSILYGFVDDQGTTLIPPQYVYAENFYREMARIYIISSSPRSLLGSPLYKENVLYGYINKSGDVVLNTTYMELSLFDEKGYAYGKELESVVSGPAHYYKIDKDGNIEEITYEEYEKNKNVSQPEKDPNITLKQFVDRDLDVKCMLLESIIPIILGLFSILVMRKIFKKEEN